MNTLILIVGLPGVGKTTTAKVLCKGIYGAVRLSMDDLATSTDGVYTYDTTQTDEIIKKFNDLVEAQMNAGTPCIIIDNTNTSLTGRITLLEMARQKHYHARIKVINLDFSDEALAKRSTHAVPVETIARMRQKLIEQGLM
ncbi:MAG: ATP-binding protein [Patescibacteria group bacterium]